TTFRLQNIRIYRYRAYIRNRRRGGVLYRDVSANAMTTDTKDIELEAACSLTERQAREILARDKSWFDKIIGGNNDMKFSFNQFDLLSYLRQRPELCAKILQFSYDKRCSPATFIEEHENTYRVGWFDK